MRSLGRDAAMAASLVLLGISGASSQSASGARIHSVTIENMQFSPAVLSVHRGDRIVWVNKDLFPHTATATNQAFDSGSIAAGASWTYVANKAGEYPYGCTLHPTMKASLTVQ